MAPDKVRPNHVERFIGSRNFRACSPHREALAQYQVPAFSKPEVLMAAFGTFLTLEYTSCGFCSRIQRPKSGAISITSTNALGNWDFHLCRASTSLDHP